MNGATEKDEHYDAEVFCQLVKEIGDCNFYRKGLQQAYNLDEDYIEQVNINKLTKRYGKPDDAVLGYSDNAAIERKDVT